MSWFMQSIANDLPAMASNSALGGSTPPPQTSHSIATNPDNEDAPTINGNDDNGNSPSSTKGKAKAASEDAILKKAFDEVMNDLGSTGKPHRQAAVLMLSWAEELDDLHTQGEISELRTVFEELFNYQVMERKLSGTKKAGLEIAKHLIDFVTEYDAESALLIVYYAGHGIPGERGELHFAGKRIPHRKESLKNAAAWHESEHIIRDADADVLLIFDCCFAGNLLPRDVRSYWPARGFECIAACGKGETTDWPGENSFTTALIWSLRTLVQKRTRFSTQELQTAIMNDAPNFPKKQYVPLIERNEPCDQRLVLAPIPKGNEETPQAETPYLEHPKYHLDLRLWYPNRPEEEEISSLARRLRKLMIDDGIGASRIGWLCLKNHELAKKERVRHAADVLLSSIRRNSLDGSYPESNITSSDLERCISISSDAQIEESTATPPAPTRNQNDTNTISRPKKLIQLKDDPRKATKAEERPPKGPFSITEPERFVYENPSSSRELLPYIVGGAAFALCAMRLYGTFFR